MIKNFVDIPYSQWMEYNTNLANCMHIIYDKVKDRYDPSIHQEVMASLAMTFFFNMVTSNYEHYIKKEKLSLKKYFKNSIDLLNSALDEFIKQQKQKLN